MDSPYGLVVMPVYNDWESCSQLIRALDEVLVSDPDRRFEVLIIDDGSTRIRHELLPEKGLQNIDAISILQLQRNIGHQRAICIALAYIHAYLTCTVVILLDSDGEDDPKDVPRLLARFESEEREKIVFAQRTKRSERWVFRFFLALYKAIHRLLTGRGISIGNFSAIPFDILSSLVIVPELWSHYAASVLHSRLPYTLVPSKREKRLAGNSKMNFSALVLHGLSAISVYSEVVATRMLIAFSALISLVVVSLVVVFAVLMVASEPIPRWVTVSSGFLVALLMQSIIFAVIFSVLTINGRKHVGFIPSRDFSPFVQHYRTLWKKS